MKGLLIRPPWIDWILDGRKTWEIRGSQTRVRGTIALIQSGTGTIVGTVDIINSREISPAEYYGAESLHCIANAASHPLPYSRIHAWELHNPRRLPEPIAYTHPRGAVIWVHLSPSLLPLKR